VREADYSPPSSVEGKNKWRQTPTPAMCLHYLYWDNITFTLLTL